MLCQHAAGCVCVLLHSLGCLRSPSLAPPAFKLSTVCLTRRVELVLGSVAERSAELMMVTHNQRPVELAVAAMQRLGASRHQTPAHKQAHLATRQHASGTELAFSSAGVWSWCWAAWLGAAQSSWWPPTISAPLSLLWLPCSAWASSLLPPLVSFRELHFAFCGPLLWLMSSWLLAAA